MRFSTVSCVCAAWLSLFMLAGCGDRSQPRLSMSSEAAPPFAAPSSPPAEASASDVSPDPTRIDPSVVSAKGDPREWWESVFAYGTKIGWCHTQITDLEEAGQ